MDVFLFKWRFNLCFALLELYRCSSVTHVNINEVYISFAILVVVYNVCMNRN